MKPLSASMIDKRKHKSKFPATKWFEADQVLLTNLKSTFQKPQACGCGPENFLMDALPLRYKCPLIESPATEPHGDQWG